MNRAFESEKHVAVEVDNSAKHDGAVALYLPDLNRIVALSAERVGKREKHSGDWISAYAYLKEHFGNEGYVFDGRADRFEPTYIKEQRIHHHLAHAANAFYPSGFEKAGILVIDGHGPYKDGLYNSVTIWKGNGLEIQPIEMNPEPGFSTQSIGLFYSAVTYFLGLGYLEEGKTMGLAPYGKPSEYINKLHHFVHIHPDGSYEIHPWFNRAMIRLSGMAIGPRWNTRFSEEDKMMSTIILTMGNPRKKTEPISPKHMDIAWATQAILEDVVLNLAQRTKRFTDCENLCFSGGVALNSVTNSKIIRSGMFKNVFIQPAAGDDGQAYGKLLYSLHSDYGLPRLSQMENAYLGPVYDHEMKIDALRKHSDAISWTRMNYEDILSRTCQALVDQKVVGWYQEGSEYGPRALGHRSILADPRNSGMRDYINQKVKHREWYRPLAPSVLLNRASEFFNLYVESPFMLVVSQVQQGALSKIPSVCHIDGSARLQTVTKEQNGIYYDLIETFGRMTGIPIILNTSFNDAGQPIVETHEDAIEAFLRMNLDNLVLDDVFVEKK